MTAQVYFSIDLATLKWGRGGGELGANFSQLHLEVGLFLFMYVPQISMSLIVVLTTKLFV